MAATRPGPLGRAPRGANDRRAALERGHRAEALVADKLVARGWRLCATNWRGGGGELDLVVEHDGKVRFVEVKVRDPRDPLADDAVGPHKRRLLRAAAEAWLLTLPDTPREMAFLVAWVDIGTEPWAIRWLDDAF